MTDPTKLPPDQLKVLGNRLARLTQSGTAAKGDLPIRWAANEAFYDNAAPSTNDSQSKMVKLHVNFLSNRVKMLTSMVCGVIGRQQPYMLAKDMQSGEREDRLEKVCHFFWQRARFEEKLRNISTIAANTNKAIWKLSYKPYDADKAHKAALTDMGIVLEAIHPDNWVCVPAKLGDLAEAKLCGNRFFERRRWITDRMDAGEFLEPEDDGELVSGDPQAADDSRAQIRSKSSPQETGDEKDDDLIELWDLVVRLDLDGQDASGADKGKKKTGEKLYHILLAIDTGQILLIEALPYSRPMYFESFYISDEKMYWSGRSVAYDLQGLQEQYNLVHSALYNAVMAEVMPLVIGSGLPEKFTRYGWGDVLNSENMIQTPWSPPSRFGGGQALIQELSMLERIGDQSARISQNTMGSEVAGSTTATQQSIIAQGVSNGQEEYISNLAAPLPAMAAATMELLDTHWDDWCSHFCLQPILQPQVDPQTGSMMPQQVIDQATGKPKMTGMLDVQRADLDAAVLWEQTGKTPGNTPQAKMQAAQLLMQAAMNPNTGLNVYDIAKVLVDAADLNADGVQANKEDMPWEQMKTQLQQSGMQPDQIMQIIGQFVQEMMAHQQMMGGQGGPSGGPGAATQMASLPGGASAPSVAPTPTPESGGQPL